jgi:DNA-binding YbaB/EbfC family protein
MANMMKMMKQAQQMQKNMEKMQAELGEKELEFSVGGGKVTVVATGDGAVRSIKIDPEVVDPEDVDMLEDLVLAAVDGAITQAKGYAAEEMAKITQGMNIPGMPF